MLVFASRGAHDLSLIFAYGASSRRSWDEMVGNYETVRAEFESNIISITTLVLAMSEEVVSREEAEAFVSQGGCLFAQYSPANGRGLCRGLGLLVEAAHKNPKDINTRQFAVKSVKRAVGSLDRSSLQTE
ncbi:hypothetical protein N0V88_003777 [Collariella sp. IMI 366227]|nr:hypothetical protein N0V88_003777 [Collariella sp. IMI 366227]